MERPVKSMRHGYLLFLSWAGHPELGAPTGGIPLPIARTQGHPESAGRVKGAERRACERTLDASEHSGTIGLR
jgi:hypothetical protein